MHKQQLFGILNNRDIDLYTLKNRSGMEVSISNYGATVTSMLVPVDEGVQEVVLGFDTLDDYLLSEHYFGAIIGRYANRIASGSFNLSGKNYTLVQNNDSNHLHGGSKGFDKVIWDATPVYADGRTGIQLTYMSCDGEEGYPGNLSVQVTYWLTDDNVMIINYLAETDAETVVCLTHHGYFNLSKSDSIKDHTLQLAADTFTPVTDNMIPTGEVRSVENSVCDFRNPVQLGALLDGQGEDLLNGGFDHNFVMKRDQESPLATLVSHDTGLKMEMYTSEPGVQLYTGNFLGTDAEGVSKVFPRHSGLCLEAQHYPNSPNCKDFPSVVLRPGEQYRQSTRYSFSCSTNTL